jgi:hypothetical protein
MDWDRMACLHPAIYKGLEIACAKPRYKDKVDCTQGGSPNNWLIDGKYPYGCRECFVAWRAGRG